jgi:hypothetical protein
MFSELCWWPDLGSRLAITANKQTPIYLTFQYVSVAAELFPLVMNGVTRSETNIGISCGFSVGLIVVFGMEHVINWLAGLSGGSDGAIHSEDRSDERSTTLHPDIELGKTSAHSDERTRLVLAQAHPINGYIAEAANHLPTNLSSQASGSGLLSSVGVKANSTDIENIPNLDNILNSSRGRAESNSDSLSPRSYIRTKVECDFDVVDKEPAHRRLSKDEMEGDWDDSTVQPSTIAMNVPQHRQHIINHLNEMKQAVRDMDKKCDRLKRSNLRISDIENLSEEIDEATHSLQYKLDHTRRLLEGSESLISGFAGPAKKMTAEKILAMKRRLYILEASASHIIEHINVSTDRLQV